MAHPKQVFIMRGVSGSGKSHLARELTEHKGGVCSADDFFVNKNGKYCYDRRDIGKAHAYCMSKFMDAIADKVDSIAVMSRSHIG